VSIFDKIRHTCRQVCESAKHVKINSGNLLNYLNSLPLATPLVMDEENHFCGDSAKTVNYFFVLDSINFGSGYFPHLRLIPGKTGYFTVAAQLKEELHRRGDLNCDFLTNIRPEECCRIFNQDLNSPKAFELMQLFAQAMNQLGEFVETKFSGSFTRLLDSANGSSARLVETLAEMPFYQDKAIYRDFEVFFMKRAQITVSDLNIALAGKNEALFEDIEQLTIFADNLVPHVLKIDGILSYSNELQQMVEQQNPVEAGSVFELEMRAAAVHTVELLKAIAADKGRLITAQQLDYHLWNRGQAKIYRRPHLTLSHFY